MKTAHVTLKVTEQVCDWLDWFMALQRKKVI